MELFNIKCLSRYMVRSKLDPDIVYPDKTSLDRDDEGKDAAMYEVAIRGIDVVIAIGQERYTFIDKNVVYFPFYLVKDGSVDAQLGVFEILSSSLPGVLDSDGDIDISKMYEPLLYQTTTDTLLKEAPLSSGRDTEGAGVTLQDEQDETEVEVGDVPEPEKVDEEQEESSDLSNGDLFSSVTDLKQPPLPTEGSDDAMEIEKKFNDHKSKVWIQRYMRNENYNVIPGSNDGDCLFEAIATAYRQIGKNTSTALLREKVSSSVTTQVFEYYKGIYKTYADSVSDDTTDLKQLRDKHNLLKKRLRETKSHSVQLEIVAEAKEVEQLHKERKTQLVLAREMKDEFGFMENTNTVGEFRELIKSCKFWADSWAISVIENALNLKIVIFDEEAYEKRDLNSVLECGIGLHAQIAHVSPSDPERYIMLSKSGSGYKLVTYRERGIFGIDELPYTLKVMIASKCIEQEQSPYKDIAAFSELRADLGLDQKDSIDIDLQAGGSDCERNIIFVINPAYAGNARPGCGPGEEIPLDLVHEFGGLTSIPEWRAVLSDDYESPITIGSKTWPSVTHYYEGSKFKKENPEFFTLFSLESESDISKDPSLAKAIGAGRTMHHGKDINTGNVKVDRDMFRSDGKGRHKTEYELALRKRFEQDPTFKRALLGTKRARLVSLREGKHPRVERELMRLRSSME